MSLNVQENLADLTLDLIRVPSVTGNETEIAEYVASWLRERLPEGWVDHVGNSVLVVPPENGKPTVGIFGHLDTVPGREDQPPRRDAERVYGTGASDMKGALAVMMELALRAPEADWSVRPVMVFYDAEEGLS